MYSLLTFLIMGAAVTYIHALRGNRKMLVLYGICMLMAIYTHYYALLFLFAVNVHRWIFERKKDVTPLVWWVVQGVILILYIPWLPVIFQDFFFTRSEIGFPWRFNLFLAPGFIFLKLSMFGNEKFVLENILVYFFGIIIMLIPFLLCFWKGSPYGVRRLSPLFLIPIIVIYIVTAVGIPIYKTYPLLMVVPLFCLHIACGSECLSRFRRIPGFWSYILIIVVIFLNVFVLIRLNYGNDYTKPKVLDAVEYIDRKVDSRGIVGVVPEILPGDKAYSFLPGRYYAEGRFTVLRLSGNDVGEIMEKIKVLIESHSEIWIVVPAAGPTKDSLQSLVAKLEKNRLIEERTEFPSKMRDSSFSVYRIVVPGRDEQI